MREQTGSEPTPGAPARVVELEIPSIHLAEQLFGVCPVESTLDRCRVVLERMLPLGEPARLAAVLPHGLSIELPATSTRAHGRLLVPWAHVSYVTGERGQDQG